VPMPFSFVFAPHRGASQDLIASLKPGQSVELECNGNIVGRIVTESVFETRPEWLEMSLFSIDGQQPHMGRLALSGEIEIYDDEILPIVARIKEFKRKHNYKQIAAFSMEADPLHRVHERLIRTGIDSSDMVIVFLVDSESPNSLDFTLRYQTVERFTKEFLPLNRLVVVPLRYNSVFAGHKHPELECIIAKNLGATKMIIGQNHDNIGMYYDDNQAKTTLDSYKKLLNLQISVVPTFVYCNQCKTIVSTKSCPHGKHHHISYHTASLRAMILAGILPPAILVRKEISAFLVSRIHPNKFADINQICNSIFPNAGLLEEHTEQEFYEQLMGLHATTSMK